MYNTAYTIAFFVFYKHIYIFCFLFCMFVVLGFFWFTSLIRKLKGIESFRIPFLQHLHKYILFIDSSTLQREKTKMERLF